MGDPKFYLGIGTPIIIDSVLAMSIISYSFCKFSGLSKKNENYIYTYLIRIYI
jgi:hypothetical protein